MSNADVTRGIYDAFGRGDIGTVLGAMSPSIAWREAESNPYKPDGEAWVGPDAIVANLFTKLAGEWDRFTVTPATFAEAGERVVVEGRYTGTYTPTGKALDVQFCHVWRVEDGKVTAFQQYTDTAQFQEVMGAKAVVPA
jgi:ketosteroid isomerase-like protein